MENIEKKGNFGKSDRMMIIMLLISVAGLISLFIGYPEFRSTILRPLTDPIYLLTEIGTWATAFIAIIGLGYYAYWVYEGSSSSVSLYWLSLLCLPGVIVISPVIGIYAIAKHHEIIIATIYVLSRGSYEE